MNLYWPIYLNLENELIDLSNKIHIDDKQLDVYSPLIADLIIRCAVEVEAISKEMYLKLNTENTKETRDLFFDTDCMEYINSKWDICAKEVSIKAINFYFTKEENKILRPLYKANKRGASSAKWLVAYQGLKHDRKNNLAKGNLRNAINALGALYILNLYYKYHEKGLPEDITEAELAESKVFGESIFNATLMTLSIDISDESISNFDDMKKCIYTRKFSEKTIVNIEKAIEADFDYSINMLNGNEEVSRFLKENKDYKIESILTIASDVGGQELVNKVHHSVNIHKALNSKKDEFVLNMNQVIYK